MNLDNQEKEGCCGCSVCSVICPVKAIRMNEDEEGFNYPVYNSELCISCGLCDRVCPIKNQRVSDTNYKKQGYAAINKSKDIVESSSSGGVFFSLAEKILAKGGAVVGAAFDADFGGVRHIIANDISDVQRLMGSKYVQSRIEDCLPVIKNELEEGRTVLFTGVACQIAALRNYLQKDYLNLVCVDVICHGVPSPGVWRSYIQHLESQNKANAKCVNFRYKKRHDSSEEKFYFMPKSMNPYMQLFLNDLILRPSCYKCQFKGFDRGSDITIGDFWGASEYVTNFDTAKGISIVLCHSRIGQALLDECSESLTLALVDYADVFSKHNQEMINSAKVPDQRSDFFKDYFELETGKLLDKWTRITNKQRLKLLLDKIGIRRVKEEGMYIIFDGSDTTSR